MRLRLLQPYESSIDLVSVQDKVSSLIKASQQKFNRWCLRLPGANLALAGNSTKIAGYALMFNGVVIQRKFILWSVGALYSVEII